METESSASACACARIVGADAEGHMLVQVDEQIEPFAVPCSGTLAARWRQDAAALDGAIVLLIDVSGHPLALDTIEEARSAGAQEQESDLLSVAVDGEPLVLSGKERIELRCGKASIILTAAGKVLIKGAYLSTTAAGTHRIRGGSVQIN